MLTRELDSFLDNRSDTSLFEAARMTEEAEAQVEKLVVRNHEVEWFEEDNNAEFNTEFASEFASSLRRDSLPSQSANNIAEFHNDLMKKQVEKYDAMVVRTTRLLKHAELTKKSLRNRIESLEKEVEETQENWQGSSESDSEEIASLKATITAKNIKIDELELAAKNTEKTNNPNRIQEVRQIVQKCKDCKFTSKDSKTLDKHIATVHTNQNCHLCEETFTSKAALRNHVRNHLMNTHEYSCNICNNKFMNLDDARAHSTKPCGNVRGQGPATDEHQDNIEYDCANCKVFFKSQSDYYKHANNCSVVIEPLICDTCNIELVSKAGLKKHMEKCNDNSRKSKASREEPKEDCLNGPDCRFLKQNRCLYNHNEPNGQPWQRVQGRRQGRQQGRQQKQTREQVQPRQQVQSRQQAPRQQAPRQQAPRQQVQSRQNVPRQQVKPRQQAPRQQVQSRQKDIECRNGPGCYYWKYNRCHFLHSGRRPLSTHSVNSRDVRQGLDSRQPCGGLDSRRQGQDLDSRQHRRDDGPAEARPCKFGAGCDRILTCGFLHLAKDFLSSQGGRRN